MMHENETEQLTKSTESAPTLSANDEDVNSANDVTFMTELSQWVIETYTSAGTTTTLFTNLLS